MGRFAERGRRVGDPWKVWPSGFHTVKEIRLADGREWTFLAPAELGGFPTGHAIHAEYLGLIRAILEAEDRYEGQMAELALAMLLVDRGRPLASFEYRRLFMFEPDSRALADSQVGFHALARDHVNYLVATGKVSRPQRAPRPAPRRLGRFLNRTRRQSPVRIWSPVSGKREMLS
jgi:hypothetical protein